MQIPIPIMTIEEYEKRFARQSIPVIAQANGEKTSDPQTEAAIAAYIACDNHILQVEDHALEPNDFSVPHWAIAYQGAKAVSDKGLKVSIASINDWIEKNALPEFKRSLGHDNSMPDAWKKWAELAYETAGGILSTNSVRWSMDDVLRYSKTRHDHQIRLGLANHTIDWQEAVELQEEVNGETPGELPKIEDSFELCEEADDTPPEIVQGIFHQGSKVMLSGGSKSFKTWQLLQLAVCVSAGHQWLKFDTTKGRVLYLNFELPKWSMRKRISEIRKALNIKSEAKMLDTWNLRGFAASGEEILPQIAHIAAKRRYALIILDPLYKLLGNRDENSARDMSNLMNEVEKITVRTHAAIAFGTHFSKGNQSTKNAIDRMSGSGVLARDPDAIIVSTEHKEPNAFGVSMILRNLPAQKDFVMRFSAPIMLVDDELDPSELKQPAGGRPSSSEERQDQILDALAKSGGSLQGQLAESTGIKLATLKRDLQKLIAKRLIFHSEIDSKYALR